MEREPMDTQAERPTYTYMKFQSGDNRFRILAEPERGYEAWVGPEGAKKPWRRRSEGELIQAVGSTEIKAKALWVMPVYNYATSQIEVLNVNQKSIQESLASYRNDEDWGDFTEYDVVVKKTGEGLETRYEVMAKPHKALPEDVQSLWQSMTLNLGRTFEPRDTSARQHDTQTG